MLDTESIEQIFQEANKLIFVQQYQHAFEILEKLTKAPDSCHNLLYHLRKIELATRLEKLPDLHHEYLKADYLPAETRELSLIFVEQYQETLSPSESLLAFKEAIQKYGESAASSFGMGFCLECQGNSERAIYNYEQSLRIDPDWYPSYFGLSQLYYASSAETQGDHYFYLFEQYAPYNLYGNFETHKRLSDEYLDKQQFDDAITAIRTLRQWWVENKGFAPDEIQIYEDLSLSLIYHIRKNSHEALVRRKSAEEQAKNLLTSHDTTPQVLYFVARAMEEFNNHDTALIYYQAIVEKPNAEANLIQKISSHILSMGEQTLAIQLLEKAYQTQPDNEEIRFFLLVGRLKAENVNLEEYLMDHQRLRDISKNSGGRVETLALLHSMLSRTDKDPDVHKYLGETYTKLNNPEKACEHYEKMYHLDKASTHTTLKFAWFLATQGQTERAEKLIEKIQIEPNEDTHSYTENLSLKASIYALTGNFDSAHKLLQNLQQKDPWHLQNLLDTTSCIHHMKDAPIDKTLKNLINATNTPPNWVQYHKKTDALIEKHEYELVYLREKVAFLYNDGEPEFLERFFQAATSFDSLQAAFELLKLLNTNFDNYLIYHTLGLLYKDLWQLETACAWFDMAMRVAPSQANTASSQLEFADCLIWRGEQLEKACHLTQNIIEKNHYSAINHTHLSPATILAHASLKKGSPQEAYQWIQQTHHRSIENTYIEGLICYRNGDLTEAKALWKPLLSTPAVSRRDHHIKQELIRYYYEGSSYPQAS
ncbi:MAG: hypothetical protein AB8C84_06140 [Oligoflexales bacterium]